MGTGFVPDATFYSDAARGASLGGMQRRPNSPIVDAAPSSVAAGVIADPILTALGNQGGTNLSGSIPISGGRRLVNGRTLWIGSIKPDTSTSGCDDHWLATFAVGFGYSVVPAAEQDKTSIVRLWANDKLCSDIVNAGLPIGVFKMSFHDGTEEPPTPDPIIVALDGDDALSYPQMMYVVFENFPLWKVQDPSDKQVPMISAEISDHVSDNTVATLLPGLTPATDADDQGMIVDHEDDLFYNFSGAADAKTMHCYDISELTEVRQIALDMNGMVPGFLTSLSFVAYDKTNKIGFTNGGTIVANSLPIVAFDVRTGIATGVFGSSTTGTDDTNTEFVKTHQALCVTCKEGASIHNVLATISVFHDYGILTYENDGTGLTFADRGTIDVGFSKISGDTLRFMAEYPISVVPDKCIPGTVAAKQDAYVMVAVGHLIHMMRIGSRNGIVKIISFNQWYTALPPNVMIDALYVDKSDGSLIVFMNDRDDATKSYVAKVNVKVTSYINASFGTVPTAFGYPVYNKQIDQYHPRYQDAAFIYSVPAGSTWVYPSGTHYKYLDLTSGVATDSPAVIQPYAPATSDYWFDGNGPLIYLNTGVTPYPSGDEGTIMISFGSSASGTVILSDVIRWLCLQGDMDEDELDISADLTDTFYGIMIGSPTDLWALMTDLSKVFNFIFYMSDGVVKFRRNETGPQVSAIFRLDENNMAVNDNSEGGALETFHTVAPASNELPSEVSVGYIDFSKDYTPDTQTYHKDNHPNVGKIGTNSLITKKRRTSTPSLTYNVPIVMTPDDALARAIRLVYEPAATMTSSTLRGAMSMYPYEPGDTGTVTADGMITQVKIQEMVFNGDWSVSITVQDDNFNTALGTGTGTGGTGDPTRPGPPDVYPDDPTDPLRPTDPTTDPSLLNSNSGIVLFDTNLIDAGDEIPSPDSILYVGATSKSLTWQGATVLVDSVPVGHTTIAAIPGFVTTLLPSEPLPWQTHDEYDIDVVIKGYTPATVTETLFLDGSNAALIGNDGRWELVFWQTATQLGPVTWRLSHIARGCRGTEINTDSHVIGDLFVPLNNGVWPAMLPEADISAAVVGKAEGDTLNVNPPTKTITYAANSKKPWGPSELTAVLGSTINDVGSTSYQNSCGGGTFLILNATREGLITVTGNFTPGSSSTFSNMVDGDDTNGASGSMVMPAGLTTAVITFDFHPSGFKQIIDELKWEQNNSLTQGNYDLDGSDDGVTWTPLKTNFDLVGGTSLNTVSWTNSTGYWYYRLTQVSGTTSNNSVKEVYFQTMADVGANDILLTWKRRDRVDDTNWVEDDLELNETTEEYSLDLMSGSTIVRTVDDLTDSLYVYTSANQSTDGFSPPLDSIKVRAYQISALVGRGHKGEATVSVES